MPASRRPEGERTTSAEPTPTLAATLVTYRDRPDRRTIYPPETNSVARMSTWLTADAAVFVDCEAMR